MNYYTIKPTKKLARYVRYFWVLEGAASKEQPYIHRTLASDSPELLFHYKGRFDELSFAGSANESFLTGIHAQTSSFDRFIIKEDFGIFGVFLYPYAVSSLFGLPAIEISNQMPDLFSLLGQAGKEIEEKMMLAQNNLQRLKIICEFLENRVIAFERPEIIDAVQNIYRFNGQTHIKTLAECSFLSERQFERIFREFLGFTPKLFSRIVRFNSVLSEYKKRNVSLTETAYDFGYYDQSHFIHEFKEFSGYNPKIYFSGKADEAFYEP